MVDFNQPSQHAVQSPHSRATSLARAGRTGSIWITLPQHFLYLLPLPQGQGSFLLGFTAGTAFHAMDRMLRGTQLACMHPRRYLSRKLIADKP